MECAYDLKPIFKDDIIKVRSDLVPVGYTGGPETYTDVKRKMNWIIDRIGMLSAMAQGLHTSVTSVRQMSSNQIIYLMAAPGIKDNSKLVIVGLLKMGPKDLYLFDERGQLRSRIGTPAVLDFFVHSSFQRRGLGKRLFDHMLADQALALCKCAVDRPSAMMSAFLAKNYGLVRPIAQANNYVLYEGFFSNEPTTNGAGAVAGATASVSTPTSTSSLSAGGGNKTSLRPSRSTIVRPTERTEQDLKVLSMAEIMEAGKRHGRAKVSARRSRE